MSAFRAIAPRSIRWRSLQQEGVEHLSLAVDNAEILASSVVIGALGGVRYGVTYTVACDSGWRARRLKLASTEGRVLELSSDGEGRWSDASGARLREFDGCIDLDLSGSPFTNTLPIRRLGLRRGDSATPVEALYVPFDSFTPLRDRQLYSCIEHNRRFRYEAGDGTFAAEVTVDDDAIVLHYPPLFTRVDHEGTRQ